MLTVITETVPTGGLVSEQEIRRKLREKVERLKQSSDTEVYYRLEQLYWMGFLKKQPIGPGSLLYSLSEGYRQYLGL